MLDIHIISQNRKQGKACKIEEKLLILIYFLSEVFKILPTQNFINPEKIKEEFLIQKL